MSRRTVGINNGSSSGDDDGGLAEFANGIKCSPEFELLDDDVQHGALCFISSSFRRNHVTELKSSFVNLEKSLRYLDLVALSQQSNSNERHNIQPVCPQCEALSVENSELRKCIKEQNRREQQQEKMDVFKHKYRLRLRRLLAFLNDRDEESEINTLRKRLSELEAVVKSLLTRLQSQQIIFNKKSS